MTIASTSIVTEAQRRRFETDGYFIIRGLIDRDLAMEVRGVIRNHIMTPDIQPVGDQIDPMDPMGNSPAARAARFRKLGQFCVASPVIWHTIHAGAPVLNIAREYLGDDILVKYNSVFVKPARTGSATPWHQDNGLWRDGEVEPFNFWIAIDPATRENGCMQFIPGSHTGPIMQHVLYEGGIHGEIPRKHVVEMIEQHGLEHIEMEPGDVVCWHSNLYHYSPPNTSDKGRIAVAGVYSTPAIVKRTNINRKLWWAMRDGQPLPDFPPEPFDYDQGQPHQPGPVPTADLALHGA